MSVEPLLAPNDLIRLSVCGLDQRLAETDAAEWPRDMGRSLHEWATLSRTSAPDLAWAMFRLDCARCLRALSAVLEAAVPVDADPRSRAVVPMLREPKRYTRDEWETVANSATEAANAAAKAAKTAKAAVDAATEAAKLVLAATEAAGAMKAAVDAATEAATALMAARAATWAARAATWAARVATWAARAVEGGASATANAVAWAMEVRPDLDLKTILLSTWEKG